MVEKRVGRRWGRSRKLEKRRKGFESNFALIWLGWEEEVGMGEGNREWGEIG